MRFIRDRIVLRFLLVAVAYLWSAVFAAEPIRVLIVDGRNNHDWSNTSVCVRATLESTALFRIDVSTAPGAFPKPQPPRPKAGEAATPAYEAALKVWKAEESDYNKAHGGDWDSWRPTFTDYAVVVNNYNGPEWPKPVKDAFVEFVRKGGGVVNVHAANNAFANWTEFNSMIGIGWRGEKFGQRVAVDDATGQPIVVPIDQEKVLGKGAGSGHGSKHPFIVKTRDPQHPIMAGLPLEWLHARDELYHRMRGTIENLHVLASAFSDVKENGTDMHEPVIWWVPFGEGRVVTTSMGHLWPGDTQKDALYCVGFQTVLARSVEWAATGKVTQSVPNTFPTREKVNMAPPQKVESK